MWPRVLKSSRKHVHERSRSVSLIKTCWGSETTSVTTSHPEKGPAAGLGSGVNAHHTPPSWCPQHPAREAPLVSSWTREGSSRLATELGRRGVGGGNPGTKSREAFQGTESPEGPAHRVRGVRTQPMGLRDTGWVVPQGDGGLGGMKASDRDGKRDGGGMGNLGTFLQGMAEAASLHGRPVYPACLRPSRGQTYHQ